MRQEARTSDRQFEMIEDLRLDPCGGPQALVSRLVELRKVLGNSGFEEIVFQSTVYAPNDLPGHRPKSEDERHMDLAALYTECNDYDSALAELNSCRQSEKEWYWHTAARRIHANRARDTPGQGAQQDWAAATEHVQFIILSATEQHAARKKITVYSFGDSYSDAASQLSAAAQTLVEYLLCICNLPEAALEAILIADATHQGSHELEEFRVTALLKLGRNTEAYEAHLKYRMNMPDVAQSEGYRAFVDQRKSQAQEAERQRISQLKFEYTEGNPASRAALELLRQRFPNLSDAYVQWITQHHRHKLTVTDGEYGETYELFSASAAQEKHEELLGWLALHDESSPELAEEIRAAIHENGINPLRMLPIVGNDSSSDCFLLRTDGLDAGSVYFWSHDQCAVFTPVVGSADQLFRWLQAQAEAGSTFSL